MPGAAAFGYYPRVGKMKESNIVLLNDKFVREEQALVSVFDRGFLYGDGLFASIRVCNGRPFRWRRHMLRVHRGADFMRLSMPQPDNRLRELAIELIQLNNVRDAILRLTISRGVGARGYSPKTATIPTLVMSLHSIPNSTEPPGWRLMTSSLTLRAADPLSFFKSCNRLIQVLARAEADAGGFDEVLLLNDAGQAVETASGNLFWFEGGQVFTPPLGTGILPGIARSVVFEVCDALGRRVQEKSITRDELLRMDGAFASLSSLGVVQILRIDDSDLKLAPSFIEIREAYLDVLNWETSRETHRT